MTYSTIAMVKARFINIDISNLEDAQFTDRMERAYQKINTKLSPFEETLPLSNPPAIIAEIEANIAAGLLQEESFSQVDGLTTEKSLFRINGEEDLELYIIANYQTSKEVPYLGEDYGFTKITAKMPWEE